MQLKIAIGQMDIVLGDRAANLSAVRQLAARAFSRVRQCSMRRSGHSAGSSTSRAPARA